ncbi:MAG: B12-binding domain-containing radical SAM protein [Candidatus Hermodarchaeota archaeon]
MRALLLGMPNAIWVWHLYQVFPNLGLTSLAGNVDEDFEVDVADLIVVRQNFKSFLETKISRHAPDIIGLSAMSLHAKTARYIARFVKQIDPEIKVILGGYHVTTMAEEIGRSSWGSNLDFMIRGEGESTFNELLRALDRGQNLRDVKSLSFKKNGEFIHTPLRTLEDLATLKLPKRSARILKKGFHSMGLKADVVEASRGCTNNCKFCSINQMYGRNFRKFGIQRVLEDIETCKKDGVKAILFADDNITLDPEHFASLCDGIIERGLNDIHYIVQTSVKGLYSEPTLLKKIVDANFTFIFMGIENPNPRNLRLIGKNVKNMAEKAERLVSYLRNHNIITIGGFIVGNPEDRASDFLNVLNYAKKIKIDVALFQFLTPFPKTKIREQLLESNLIINPDDFSYYDTVTPNVKTNYLTREEIVLLRGRMWNEFFSIPWLFTNNLVKLYPRYFFKSLIHAAPRVLKNMIEQISGIKSEYEIAEGMLQIEHKFRNLQRFQW